MAVRNINLPNFPTFDIAELSTVATRWKKYKKRFNILCDALTVTDDKQKLAMFLNYVGEEVYDVYENILTEDDHTFDEVIAALNEHFEPKVNHSFETYIFRQMKQKADETVQQYYIKLKEQAVKCDFRDLEIELKQQIDIHTTNNQLRRFSFRNPEKSLQEILVEAKTMENTNLQADEVENSQYKAKELNAVRDKESCTAHGKEFNSFHRKMSSNPKKCFRCDGNYPHSGSCPAQNKSCNKCGKMGHYAKCCKVEK